MSISLDSWGTVTPDNYIDKVKRTTKFKPCLLQMANIVLVHAKNFENKSKTNVMNIFISDGSLLGAVRDGKMIPSDYDFDYGAICHPDILRKFYLYLNENINSKYTVRLVDYEKIKNTDYALKIMVYDESLGVHRTDEPDWYNVILDVQHYNLSKDGDVTISYYRDNHNEKVKWKIEDCLPMKKIKFESFEYPCLKDPIKFLTESYGYIGLNAVFDKKIGKYVKVEE